MITIKSHLEIDAMYRAGDVLAGFHIVLREIFMPGVDMLELEE
ncbi:hypothetical protein ACJBXB_10405 [Streptococcus suis]